MSNNVKVSVIVPIYNVEEYLEECLDSLVNQSIRENNINFLEVLMIDDGSTDSSGIIAQRYERQYENFCYILKENGGLGQARNYGLKFAHGEYIAFLDADDIVPEDAYEKMYLMAEKTGNDLIVGDVVRFNTRRQFKSNLHRRAFINPADNTHILNNPDLVFDTTSWNKLYKFNWWKKNNFRFPENILYEDIPVTIPAHFKANRVSILNDVVYQWRIRDGVSKSITQNRTEYKNFSDRLKIIRMVDEFYNNNVTDAQALFMKDYKWLDVDLKLYINQFLKADEEYVEAAMLEIRDYIKNIPSQVFQALRAIDRMKYYLIQKGDKENLMDLLRYARRGYKALKVRSVGDRYFGSYPLPYIPKEMFDMTDEFNRYPVTQKIQKMSWEGNILKIQGYIYDKYLNVTKKDDQKLTAYLVNIDNSKEIKINISPCIKNNIRRIYKVDREKKCFTKYNYKWAGYEIELDFSDFDLSDYLEKTIKIKVDLERRGIKKTFWLGQPVKGKESRERTKNINGIQVYTTYNLSYDLIFTVRKPMSLLNCSGIDGESFILDGELPCNEKIVFKSKKDTIYPEVLETKDSYNKKNFLMKVNIADFTDGRWTLMIENSDKLVSFYSDQCKDVLTEKGITSLYNKADGTICLETYKKVALLNSIKLENQTFQLQFILFNNISIDNTLEENTFQLNIKGKENGRNYYLPINKYKIEDNKIILDVLLEVSDTNVCGTLTQDKWTWEIIHIHGKKESVYSILGQWNMDDVVLIRNKHKYIIYTGGDRKLYLWVGLIWNSFENTKQKRRIITKYIYPLFRLLPIKNNRIIFEGWWGKKYHCNPRYLYEYIDTNYPEYDCVWSMNDELYSINGRGKTVRRNSLKYHFYMATSKFFVNNVNFMDSYEKRKKQIEIQTMHGTPLKTLGLDVPGEITTEQERIRFLRRCDRWDYLIVQSHEAERITSSCFAYSKTFLETGYPRNDILFSLNTKEGIANIKSELEIPIDKKVVLYAPTWRHRNKFDLMLDIADMKKRLGEDYVLLMRIHPYALAGFNENIVDEFVYNVSSYPSIEKLYVISEMLITDYSSAMFDYAILNRPIIFFAYDLESYRDNLRGFNIDLEKKAPGPIYKTSLEVVNAIENIDQISKEYDCALQKFRKKYCEFETGHACMEIMSQVFKK